MEFVEKNIDKSLDWSKLSTNHFDKDRENFLLDKHRQFIRENLKEELAMVASHPLYIKKYLKMGYKILDLDDIM